MLVLSAANTVMVFDVGFKDWVLAGTDTSTRQGEDWIYYMLRFISVRVMPFGLKNAPVTLERIVKV